MRLTPVLLILAFFLALLPLAGNYAVHHPDEQYYTAAAIRMVQGGDYLTPRDAEGRPRFQKPILTYWLLAASYRLFGIDPLSSRLPFLLAGCAVLAVTYAMSRQLIPDPAAAPLALSALVAHPQLVLASLRSMTDVVLALALTVSAWGFLAVIAAERRSRAYLAMAYGGAAVAFLSKGFVAVAFVVFALSFAFAQRRRRGLGALVDRPAMLGAAALCGAWFVGLPLLNGGEALAVFLRDQAGGRFALGLATPVKMIPAFIALYFVGFLPWSMPAVRALPADELTRAPDEGRRRLRRFILLWSLLLAAVFGLAREPEEHYVLPAIPLLGVLIGDVLAGADSRLRERLLRQALAVTFVCVLLGGLAMAWTQQQVDASAGAMLALGLLLAAAALCGAAGLARLIHTSTAQALVLLLVFPMLAATMAPIALPDQGEQLAARLGALGVRDRGPILLFGESGTAGKLRVASGGALDVRQAARDCGLRIADCGSSGDRYAALVLPPDDGAQLDSAKWELHSGSRGYRSMDVLELFGAIGRGRLRGFLDRHRTELAIALRRADG